MALITDPAARRVRRADHRARRDHADRSAARVQEGDARTRHDGGVCVARSRRGRADGRPHRRAERRRGARDRHDRRRCSTRRSDAYTRQLLAATRRRERGDAPPSSAEARAAARNPRPDRRLWAHRRRRHAGRAGARRREPHDPARRSARRDWRVGLGQDARSRASSRAWCPRRAATCCSTASRCRRSSGERTPRAIPAHADRVPERRHGAEPERARSPTSSARPLRFYHGLRGAAARKRMLDCSIW